MIMEKVLSHSFNVCLGEDILKKLRQEQEKLAKVFTELRPYDSSPHLSIGTKFMTESETGAYLHAVAQEFKSEKTWELTLSDFEPSDAQIGKYIFLTLAPESRERMFSLHERLFRATKGIGSEGMHGPTPKYPYDPHISLIKVQPEEMPQAIQLIQEDLGGVVTPVTRYELTRQKEDEKGFSTFPVMLSIDLQQP